MTLSTEITESAIEEQRERKIKVRVLGFERERERERGFLSLTVDKTEKGLSQFMDEITEVIFLPKYAHWLRTVMSNHV